MTFGFPGKKMVVLNGCRRLAVSGNVLSDNMDWAHVAYARSQFRPEDRGKWCNSLLLLLYEGVLISP